jgi:hypothetical protein
MIGGIFEADGDIFDMQSVNRGLLVLERNGYEEKGVLRYQMIDENLQVKKRAVLKYNPSLPNEDLEYHVFLVRDEIYKKTGAHIEITAFNIFRN